MPAICSTFLGTRAATMPAPRGAGISFTITEPHLPVTCTALTDQLCAWLGVDYLCACLGVDLC